MARISSRRVRRRALAVLSVGLALGLTGIAWAAFYNTTVNPPSTFSAKRIFPAERVTAAWNLEDAADGSAASVPYSIAFVDASVDISGNWTSSWSTSRYLEYELASPLPAGLSVSGARFDFTFADNDTNVANQWCYYFETRKTSDASLIQAHGSSGSTIGCEAAGLQTTISTALSEITTTDQANDLTIRVYGMHSGGAKKVEVDRATVSGAGYSTFTLYPNHDVDSSTGTPATAYWGPAKVNAQSYTSTNWATAYAAGRYLKFTFPGYVPTSATLVSASFEYAYRSSNGTDNVCYYFEVYAGASLIGTHGGTGADIDCNPTASYETITTALAEVDTTAEANSIVIKLFGKNVTGARPTLTDGARLKLTYSLDAGSGCANAGTQTVTAAGDTFVRQDSATQNFGTTNALDIRSQLGNKRRVLVGFAIPPLGAGCSITAATLRAFLNTTNGSRTIGAYQVNSSWTEYGVTWNTQPTTTGSPVSATTGAAGTWTTWSVTSIVQAQVAGTNNGFLLRDAAEDTGNITNSYQSRENTNDPELVLTVG
jgi:hypothetical protein